MRIIRAARRVQEAQITCPYCKSVLGIEREDIKYFNMDYNVVCPVCETTISGLKKDELFPWVMEDDDNDRKIQGNNLVRKYEV